MLKPGIEQEIRDYLANKEGCTIDYPFEEGLAVYSVKGVEFAYYDLSKHLPRLSLRADPLLAQVLRAKYEEVLPASKLNPKLWNTVIISGQLEYDDLTALIDHSYILASEKVNQA